MSRPAMTFERYATIMHMPPAVIVGVQVGECGGMTCQDRRQLANDIAMAVQKIDDVLAPHQVSLADKEVEIETAAPYWMTTEYAELRQFKSARINDVAVTYSGSGNARIATVDLEIGLEECEQFESAEVISKPGPCMVYPADWSVEISESGFSMWTYAYNISSVDDNQTVTEPAKIDLNVKTSVPSCVKAVYRDVCSCDSKVCEQCNGQTLGSACWSLMNGVMDIRALTTCSCVRGEPVGYRFKVIRRGVGDDALDDAIVSLANYRQAISTCSQCNFEAQARLKRDLGITEQNQDIRTKTAPWAFNNPFGIQTPGALAAWGTIQAKFGIASVVGHA